MMERAPVRIPQSKTLINTDENTNSKTHNQTLFLERFTMYKSRDRVLLSEKEKFDERRDLKKRGNPVLKK